MNAKPRESKPILQLTNAKREASKVQFDDNYLKVPRALLQAVRKARLSANQQDVFWAVFEKTCGWQKEFDWVCNEQICELMEREPTKSNINMISDTKKLLIERKILLQNGKKIGVNLVLSEWENPNLIGKKSQRGNPNLIGKKSQKGLVSNPNLIGNTKETITKENINITPLPPTGASVEQGEETSSLAKPKSEPVDYEGVMEAWNEVFAETPIATIRVMSDERKRQVHRLAKNLRSQFGNYSVKAFRDYFADFWQQIASQTNSWYLGHNQRKWVADFDYLMKPKTFAKTVEESL